MKPNDRNKASRPAKPRRAAGNRVESTPSKIVVFPAGTAIPDSMPSTEAKDRISDVVKKAAAGGRTTVVSRGYAIAIIGPLEDIPAAVRKNAVRLPTTEIKSGQTSIKGIIARDDCAVLTVHGEPRAAVYRPIVQRRPAETEDKLDRLIELLDATKAADQRNQEMIGMSVRLKRLADATQAQIVRSLDLLEKIDRDKARMLHAQYAELQKQFDAIRID